MRAILALVAVIMGLTMPAAAQQGSSPLRAMTTSDDTRGWEAVGRLNIAGTSMCTGALIAPDLVLTAAHCLFDRRTNRKIDETGIEFLAGWRNGRATAYRWVKRAVVHPDYTFGVENGSMRVRNDVALLQLDQPIRKPSITPFLTDARPRKGDEIGVVSYAHDRADSPSMQETCYVLARQSGTLVMSCDVDFGSSGAPVFVMQDGEPRIVSVVSAKAELGERKVSLGTALDVPLAALMHEYEATDGVFKRKTPPVRRLSSERERSTLGAKFLRP